MTEDWRLIVLLIKTIAEEKGISHQEIGDKAGVKRPHVSRVFSLRYRPRLDLILSIMDAVGVSISLTSDDIDLNLALDRAKEELKIIEENSTTDTD